MVIRFNNNILQCNLKLEIKLGERIENVSWKSVKISFKFCFPKTSCLHNQPFIDIASQNFCKYKRRTSAVEYCFVKFKA